MEKKSVLVPTISCHTDTYYPRIEFEDVTIMLQGILNPAIDIIYTIDQYLEVCPNIILSIYQKTEDPSLIERIKRFPTVQIVDNDLEEYKNELKFLNCDINAWRNSVYFHLNTTQKGLNLVKTKYVIKSRVDHFYTNIKDMITLSKDSGKIVCSSFPVEGIYHKFFLSECLFGGLTHEVQRVVKLSLLNYCKQDYDENHPEVLFWRPYILYKMQLENIDYTNDEAYLDFLEKYFIIWPLNHSSYYKMKIFKGWICERMEFLKTKTTREYLTQGSDIELVIQEFLRPK